MSFTTKSRGEWFESRC